jgi:hypothetical protein
MLEDALRNEKSHPAEIALAMISFLDSELSGGGQAAEARFLNLYKTLCERVFGLVLGAENGYRHKDGGWFSLQYPWTRPPSSAQQSPHIQRSRDIKSTLHRSEASLGSDPVVKLLGTNPKLANRDWVSSTLLEAVCKLSESRPAIGFAFQFHALPQQLQDTWLALIVQSMGDARCQSEFNLNDVRLLGGLLRKPPADQRQLRNYKQRQALKKESARQPLHISPRSLHSATPMKASPGQATIVPPDQSETEPNAMLTVLEHYLFLFLRFPVMGPDRKATAVSSIPGVHVHRIPTPSSSSGQLQGPLIRELYGEAVYFHIFRQYLRYFLPYEPEEKRSIAITGDCYESELFLRIVIAMWLDSRAPLTPTGNVVQKILARRPQAVFDLSSSYDLAELSKGNYESPPALVHRCLRELIIHAVLDPALHGHTDNPVVAKQSWSLTPCMSILQYPVYNYIRTSMRYSSVHSPDSAFYEALNLWLIWCEPWNATRGTQ